MSNATQSLLDALTASPGDVETIAALESAWVAEGDNAALATQLPEYARAVTDSTARARFLIAAAHAARFGLSDEAGAQALLSEALVAQPDGQALCDAAIAAYEGSQDWKAAIGMLLDIFNLTEDKPTRARLLFTAGKIQEDRLFDRERAVPYYQKAFKEYPAYTEPLETARAIFRLREHWGTVIKLYATELRVTQEPARKAQILKEMGDLNVEKVKDAEAALTNYREAQAIDANFPGLREAIANAEALLNEDAEGVEIAADLAGEAPAAAAASPAAAASAPAARAAAAARPAAGGRKSASAKEEAEVPAAPLGEALPDRLPAVSAAIDADTEEFVLVHMDAARAASGRLATAYYGRAIARMLALDLDTDEVIQATLEAIDRADDKVVAVRDLLPAFVDRRFTCEQITSALEESGAAPEAIYAMAFYGAGDRERAAALRADAGAWGAIDGLALEWADKGNWRKAGTVLEQALTAAGERDVETEAFRLQAFLCVAVDQSDKAADALRRVLRKHKTERQALELSIALYRSLDRAPNLADSLKNLVAALDPNDTPYRSVLLRELVVLYRDELKQDMMVVTTLQQLVEIEPENTRLLNDLGRMLEQMGRYPDLVAVLRKKAEASSDTQERGKLWREIAALYEERLSNQAEAITAWEAVVDIDGSDVVALEKLDGLYEKRREWEKLIDIKRRRRDLEGGTEGLNRLREAAEIAATRMRNQDLANQLWSDVLDADPTDASALAALEQLYERGKDWANLADVLSKRVPTVTEPKERGLALLKLGQLYGDRLQEPEKALAVWEELLQLEPDNARARDSVRKAYIELERWDDLESFYAKDNAWADYVRQVESAAGSISDESQQVDLLFRAARGYIDRLGTPDRAVRALERILQIEPDNAEAATLLAPIYEDRNDVRKLPPVLAVILDNTHDESVRYDLYVKLAELQTTQLRDADAGLTNYIEALALQPAAQDLYRPMLEVAERAGDWQKLNLAWADARAAIAGVDASREAWVALTRLHGNTLEVRLGDMDSALDAADELLNVLPGDEEALAVRERIFRRREDWDSLLDVLEAQRGAARDSKQSAEILAEICRIHAEKRGDAHAAIERYNELRGLRPNDRDVLSALRGLYAHEDVEDYESYATISTALLEGSTPDERRSLRLDLAQTYVSALDRPQDAIAQYAAMIEERPTDRDAREGLEAIVSNEDVAAQVAQVLAPVYERSNDWRGVVEMLEIQAAATDDVAAQVALLSRVGELQTETLRDFDAAFSAWSRVLTLDPTLERAREQAEAAAARRENWGEVVDLYEGIFADSPQGSDDERARAVVWGERLADLYDGRMGSLDDAIDAHQRVLQINNRHWPSRRALASDLFPRAERFGELADLLQENIALQDDAGDRRLTRASLADVYATRLDDADSAVNVWNDVLRDDASDSEALENLDALYEALGDASAQSDILSRRVALQSPGSSLQLSLKLRQARLADEQLGDLEQAMSLLREVVEISPRNPEAREYLESLLANEDASLRASEILEPLYAEDGDDAALTRVLHSRLQWEQEPATRRQLFGRIARLQSEALGDHGGAFATLVDAQREFADDQELLASLYKEAEITESWAALAGLLDELADEVSDPALAVDYRTRVALLRRDYLGDVEAAAESWRQVLDADPASQEALDALDTIYADAGAWRELVEIVQRKAELAEGDASLALHFRAADLLENRLGEIDEAIETLRGITNRQPDNGRALNELERLYMGTERWDELVETFEAKIAAASDARTRRDLQMQRGMVLEQGLGEDERAADAYRAALELVPGDREALDALDANLARTENWAGLLEVLGQKLDVAGDDERLDLIWRKAVLREGELSDVQGALEDYASILRSDRTHAGAVEALEAMIERGDVVVDAANLLDGIYRGVESWTDVARLNSVRLEHAYEAPARRALLLENAGLFEKSIGDDALAFASLRQAFEEAPESSDLDRLEGLATRLENWEELAEVFEQSRDEAQDADVRRNVGVRLAKVRENRLGDVDGAIEAFVRVQEDRPDDALALESLDRLYQQTGNWETLVDVLRQRIELAGDDAARNRLRLRQANVLQEFMEDGPEAIRVYREVLAADADDNDAIAALEGMCASGVEVEEIAGILEPIYRSREAWGELVALGEVRATYAELPDERYGFFAEMAGLQAGPLADPNAAIHSWSRALVERPSDEPARLAMEELGEANDLWVSVYEGYNAVLGSDATDEERAAIAGYMANIAANRLGDTVAAEQAWLVALEIQPEDAVTLEHLDALYASQERWTDLSEVLGRRREVVYDQDLLADLTVRHARLYRDQLEDIETSEATWVEALDLQPENDEVLRSLESIYRNAGNAEALYENYERQLALAKEPADRAVFLRELAILNTDSLGRPEDAVDAWNRLLQETPGNREALFALAELHYNAEEQHELVETYRRLIEVAENDEERAELLRRIAQIQAWQLENDHDAVGYWNEVLAILPEDDESLASLRVLYDRMSDEPKLAQTLERQLELGQIAEEELAGVFERLGTIYVDVTNEPEKAIHAWTEVRTRVPGHEEALQRLDDLYTNAGAWTELVGVLEEKAERAEADEDKIELFRRVAGIWTAQAPDADKAATAWESVVDLDLTDEEGVRELERLYAELGTWDALASLYVDRLDVVEDSFEKVQILRNAADVYRNRLEQTENAYLILKRALYEEPLDDALRAEVEVLAGEAGKWDDLSNVYRELIGQVAEDGAEEDALALMLANGRVLDAELQSLDMAEAFYDRALAVDPENEVALNALSDIYTRMEDWDSLVRIVRKRTEIVYEPEAQGALFREIGRIHEELRGDLPASAAAYYEALDVNDRDGAALDAVERVETKRGAWVELIDVLDRRLMQTYEPVEQTELRTRMAGLWRDNVRDDSKAIDAFNEVLMGAPDDIASMVALEELYGRNELWDDYVEIIARRASIDTAPETLVELYNKQAYVYEVVHEDVDSAINALNSALEAVPDHLETIEKIEAIYFEQERWYELVDIYERHQGYVEGEEKSEVLQWLGDTHADHMENPAAAVEAFARSVEANPANVHSLKRAAELSVEPLERYEDASAYYDALAAASDDAGIQRDATLLSANLLADYVGKWQGAVERFQRVLESNPEDSEGLEGLQKAYAAGEQWQDAIRVIHTRLDVTRELEVRSQLQSALGDIYELHLGDVESARAHYETAIEFDPTNIYAASPLVNVYIQEGRWEGARPLLEQLIADDRYQTEDDHLAQLHFLLGRSNEELAFDDDAIDEFRKCLDIAPEHADSLTHIAAAYARVGNYAEAINYQNDYLRAWSHAVEPAVLAEAWATSGRYYQADQDAISAEQSFKNALSVDENHAGALRGLVELSEGNADPSLVIEAKGRLLEHTEDPLERFRLFTDVGDAYSALGDTEQAIKHYRGAVDLQPESRTALTKLLKAYQEAENWKRATEVLGILAKTETNAERRTRYFYAIALMFRDQMGDAEKAVEFLNVTLDQNPMFLEAFQDLDALITETRDWKNLERAYVRMLERIKDNGEPQALALRKLLLKNLGEIYRSRLDNPRKAIQAYKLASDLDPTDEKLLELLAALYAEFGDDPEMAIAAHRRMIVTHPLRVESYRALFEAYVAKPDVDRAWNMAAALTTLGKADAKEANFYEQGLGAGHTQPSRALTREQWNALRHPDLDPILTDLFELSASYLRPYASDVKNQVNNKKKDRINLSEPTQFTRAMGVAIRVIGCAEPELYMRREENGMRNANADPAAIIVGNDTMQSKPERELSFEVGKMASLMRPEFYMASALPSSEFLRNVLAASLAVVTGQIIGATNVQDAQTLAHDIQRLPEQVQARVRQTVQRLLESGRNPDVSAWLRAVDHTASRAGLLMCGDLRTAVSMVKNEANPIGKAEVKDKIRELIVFSVSEEYLNLRQELGISVG